MWIVIVLLLSTAATAAPPTKDAVLAQLAPASAFPPFRIIDEEIGPKGSVAVVRRVETDKEILVLQNLPGLGRPTREEATEWLASLKPGDGPSIVLSRVIKGTVRPSTRSTLKIISRLDDAQSRATTTVDRVEGTKITTIVASQIFARLAHAEQKDGTRSLFLSVTKCADGPVYLGTTKLKIADGKTTVELPVKESEITRRFARGQACEDIMVNVTDNLPLHSLLAGVDDSSSVTVRLVGEKTIGDVPVYGEGAMALRRILTIHYAD